MMFRIGMVALALASCASRTQGADGRSLGRAPGPSEIGYAAQNLEVRLGACPGPAACLPPPLRPVADAACSVPARGRVTCDFTIGLGPPPAKAYRCSSLLVFSHGEWQFPSPYRPLAELCRPAG